MWVQVTAECSTLTLMPEAWLATGYMTPRRLPAPRAVRICNQVSILPTEGGGADGVDPAGPRRTAGIEGRPRPDGHVRHLRSIPGREEHPDHPSGARSPDHA